MLFSLVYSSPSFPPNCMWGLVEVVLQMVVQSVSGGMKGLAFIRFNFLMWEGLALVR